MNAAPIPTDLQRVEPSYRSVLRLRAAMFWLPLFAGSMVADRLLLAERGFGGWLPALIAALAAAAILVGPGRAYRRLGYAFDDSLLRVARGWLLHVDTIVPFVRVQHVDVARGPLDKLFGTASLTVHTAGTHNSTVVLPGVSPERAAEIRDAIRGQIRADDE